MKTPSLRFLAIPILALLTGCASPEARIKKNPELFNSFPPDVQERVRKGDIDIGYTKDMVTIALGEPNRVYSRQTESGLVEVWSYTDFYTKSDRQRVDVRSRVRDSSGSYRTVSDWVWVDVDQRTEFEHLRVELRDEKVIAIERLQR